MRSILFVCLGNICRSPAAEGVMKHMAQKERMELHVESCGLGDWHKGHLPDERMREATQNRGITLLSRAQMIQPEFFDRFDLIFVADQKVMKELYKHAQQPDHKNKLHLITHYSGSYKNEEIPDPYYEGEAAFERVLDMIEDSCAGILAHLKSLDKK